MKAIIAASVSLLLLVIMIAPLTATAATDSVTVSVSPLSVTGSGRFTVSGAVTAASDSVAGTAVFVQVQNSTHANAAAVSAPVAGTGASGTYSTTITAGGGSTWKNGTFTVSVTYGTSATSAPATASTTFTYSTSSATTTTATTTTTTTTSTTPTTTTTTTSTTPTTTTTTTTTTTSQTQIPPNAVRVSIVNGASTNTNSPGYSPATITVVIGTNNTVAWTNNDVSIHTVTANDKSFDSGDIAPGGVFLQTFTTPGIFAYHCVYHSWMAGTVVVKAAGGTTTTTSSTTSTTSTPTTTTTTTPSQTSTSASSSATSTSSGGGIPEFPFQLLAVSVFTALVVASYVLARRRQVSGDFIGRPSA